MAVTYAFGNRDSNIRLTGRMIAQEFISDSNDAISTVEVYLDRSVANPDGNVYVAILEKQADGTPGRVLARSAARPATDVNSAGGQLTFTFNNYDPIPANTAMFFAVIHDGPVKYTDEVGINADKVTNGSLAWSGGALTNWETIEDSPNSTITDASPGVLFTYSSTASPLPTIYQEGILEVGRGYEVRITCDEATLNEAARLEMLVYTDPDGTVDWMEDPFNPNETLCRIRIVAESSDLYITLNNVLSDGSLDGSMTQIITNVAVYPLDGEYQRNVELGVDSISPTYPDGALWIREPNGSWVEDTSQDAVFVVTLQAFTLSASSPIRTRIDSISWDLDFFDNPGNMSEILGILNEVMAYWENQRERILQFNGDGVPTQANWQTLWEAQGYTGTIDDGVKLWWYSPTNGFAGKWEVYSGVARDKSKYLKGTSEFYYTAHEDEDDPIIFPPDEALTPPRNLNWWMDDDTGASYNTIPMEFEFTLHRAAYLRLINLRHVQTLSMTANEHWFHVTVDGHHILDRTALDHQFGGSPGRAWVPYYDPASGAGGIAYDLKAGAKSEAHLMDFMWPILLPPGKHRIRYGWITDGATGGGTTEYSGTNRVYIETTSLATYWFFPDCWEFIYA